ncbi:MAG TPA: uracil-xanthine permease [Clostridiales bacterium]|nr:uracil-xanthine permease [Clostridiales bacterium]
MKLTYGIKDRPSFAKTLVFALQQLLAILAATIAVPAIVGNGMSASAALFGAGVGTIVYLLFTKFRSPVFLGSSFAFIGSMLSAFAGAYSASAGFLGLIIGAGLAGLVYVIIAIVIKLCGTGWVNKLMPAVVIGPTVAIIGLSLAGNAVGDVVHSASWSSADSAFIMNGKAGLELICGLVTLFTVVLCSVYGKKMFKMIPFILGICAGYLVASIFTVVGTFTDKAWLKIIDFSTFKHMKWYPEFSFIKAFKGNYGFGGAKGFFSFLGTIAVAYVPVAFVVFAEHIADHKNLSTVIEKDLLSDPCLDKTLLGDGVGSMVGAFFGGCPNTTYGESVGCVAISGCASVYTILTTAILAIVSAFIAPFTTFLATIPNCVMGGVCITLYGFIAVSGLKMIQKVDLEDNRNLFVVCAILIAGVGGLALKFGKITLTEVACALVLGIILNVVVRIGDKKQKAQTQEETCEKEVATEENVAVTEDKKDEE